MHKYSCTFTLFYYESSKRQRRRGPGSKRRKGARHSSGPGNRHHGAHPPPFKQSKPPRKKPPTTTARRSRRGKDAARGTPPPVVPAVSQSPPMHIDLTGTSPSPPPRPTAETAPSQPPKKQSVSRPPRSESFPSSRVTPGGSDVRSIIPISKPPTAPPKPFPHAPPVVSSTLGSSNPMEPPSDLQQGSKPEATPPRKAVLSP